MNSSLHKNSTNLTPENQKPQNHHRKTRNRQRKTTMTKKCELCNSPAQIYCSSDTASLCYTCDQTVHSANFLVAKHSRTLLCHKCQSQTPWTASGLHLGRTVSLCVNCVGDDVAVSLNDVVEEDDDVEEESDDEEESDESEDEDAQVVPWSSDDVAPPCASGGCESNGDSDEFRSGVKRCRFDDECDDRIDSSEDDTSCSSERSNTRKRTETDDAMSRPFDHYW